MAALCCCATSWHGGFLIERLIEPQPTPEAASFNPDDYERLQRVCGFVALRLVPRP